MSELYTNKKFTVVEGAMTFRLLECHTNDPGFKSRTQSLHLIPFPSVRRRSPGTGEE